MKRLKKINRVIGPGLLMAGAAIGISHLVLATRAGAHHGMVFFWIILAALLFKYPAFEFGPRYAAATGHSLLHAYLMQGKWAIGLFTLIILVNMFTVTAAIGATAAGLLSSLLGLDIDIKILTFLVLLITSLILILGQYKLLDTIIKVITVVLVITVLVAFIAVLMKGPIDLPVASFKEGPSLLEGAGLALLISLLGFMPAGMEGPTFNSIWTVVKIQQTGYHPTLKEVLLDFRLGYMLATVTAIVFLIIGAHTVYGTGALLEGNPTTFSKKLLIVLTERLGSWTYPVMGLCAFGAIYGTLITVLDAFTRTFVRCMGIFRFGKITETPDQKQFLHRNYVIFISIVSIGAFFIFSQFGSSLVRLLYLATIISFFTSPIIATLNHRAVFSDRIDISFRPPILLKVLSYCGIGFLVLLGGYFLVDVMT